MNKFIDDEINESLRQCGFNSLNDYLAYRDAVIQEAEMSIAKNKKNIFQKIGNWLNVLFSHSKESN